MITRGIVEEVVNKYQVRVRIPIYHKSATAPFATPTRELNEGAICTVPNCHPNYRVGDIVLLGFEEEDIGKPVIIGMLYSEVSTSTCCDQLFSSLAVSTNCKLPYETAIGNVHSNNISCLEGLITNVQQQFDSIIRRLEVLESSKE